MSEIAAARLNALLRGEPGLDTEERRVAALVRDLRSAPLRAPEGLRERVRASVPAEPRVRLPRVPLRRTLLVLAPLAVASVLVAAIVDGVVNSGTPPPHSAAVSAGSTVPQRGVVTAPPVLKKTPEHDVFGAQQGNGTLAGGFAGGAVPVPPTGRLTDVQASMRVRVPDLNDLGDATAQAQRIVRGLGGYVQSVDYTAPRGQPGNSYIELRVPVSRVQDALLRLAGLGTVLQQQVSTQDLQAVLDRQNAQIAALRRQIHRLVLTLGTSLPADVRLRLQLQLDEAKSALASRTHARKSTVREGTLAKVSFQLTTEKAAGSITPVHRGRFDRAIHRSLGFLAGAAAVALTVLIALSPLVLLGAMWLAATRVRRRREERRLLAA